jgi:hypothetical protein
MKHRCVVTHTISQTAILSLLRFFSCGAAAQRGLWPPYSRGFRDHTHDAPQSVGLLWTNVQFVAAA